MQLGGLASARSERRLKAHVQRNHRCTCGGIAESLEQNQGFAQEPYTMQARRNFAQGLSSWRQDTVDYSCRSPRTKKRHPWPPKFVPLRSPKKTVSSLQRAL